MGQLATFEVGDEMAHPSHQILPLRFNGPFQHDGVGQQKIAGAHRFGQGCDGEVELLAPLVIQAVHRTHRIAKIFGEHQIGLMEQGKGRVLAPCGIGKAAILARQ